MGDVLLNAPFCGRARGAGRGGRQGRGPAAPASAECPKVFLQPSHFVRWAEARRSRKGSPFEFIAPQVHLDVTPPPRLVVTMHNTKRAAINRERLILTLQHNNMAASLVTAQLAVLQVRRARSRRGGRGRPAATPRPPSATPSALTSCGFVAGGSVERSAVASVREPAPRKQMGSAFL
ncbi:hypothetical protein EVAR_15718_1 [Eumeta japonica]|uniref:Uncharacterized protein n=1 Tax=Eumeta variegata TaxID=151549 RepID=A0A4C1U9D1_EUMVA|nr:hypothetical protein EVAR_15718_1 [Eumeta japonica]